MNLITRMNKSCFLWGRRPARLAHSAARSLEDLGVRLPIKELPHSGSARPELPIYNELSPKEHLLGKTLQFPALIKIVVCPVVSFVTPVGQGPIRIPDHDVRISIRYQSTFRGI